MSAIRKWIAPMVASGLLLLTSCGQSRQAAETTDWTPLQIARAILESQPEPPPMTAVLPGDGLYDSYIEDYYQLDPAGVADGAIFCADTASAQEIAVLRLAEGADTGEAERALSDYGQRRAGAFTGYLPEEAALAENASVTARGNMVALLICREPDVAGAAFERAFTEPPPGPEDLTEAAEQPPNDDGEHIPDAEDNAEAEDGAPEDGLSEPDVTPRETETDTSRAPEPEPEPAPELPPADTEPEPASAPEDAAEPESALSPADGEEPAPPQPEQAEDAPWRYDPARLLGAWRQGDWSALARRDREILNACQAVIGKAGFSALSDYEKELAVHDWMIGSGGYDTNELNNLTREQANPDNDNPYGFLIGGVGICRGYTSTFQLFMDLLGIECISVSGQSHSTREEHAWNMVRLEGEWYCVDVTWDDPVTDGTVSAKTAHKYFNVTSEFMRATQHYWDESAVPEATASDYAWK